MGACISLSSSDSARTMVAVITVDGTLMEYSAPVTVSSVLGSDDHLSSFLCSSDSLYFDTCIPALELEAWLELGQIYFVLPIAWIHSPLSASDMAALAAKASSAFAAASKRRGRSRIHVAPVEGHGTAAEVEGVKRFNELSVGLRGRMRSVAPRYCNVVRMNTIVEEL